MEDTTSESQDKGNLNVLRRDVVYKSILRQMRKFILTDFNKKTRYMNLKRYRDKTFYEACVTKYVEDKETFLHQGAESKITKILANQSQKKRKRLCYNKICLHRMLIFNGVKYGSV